MASTYRINSQEARHAAKHKWKRHVKRAIDLIFGSLLLLFAAPIMLVAGLAIWITDRGPIFYPWQVVGLHGRPFLGWKFRTMVCDADRLKADLLRFNEMRGPTFKMKDDPRVTKVGRVLRKYSIDELPQLWSVIKGDMSLVGPRPPLVSEFEKFEPWQQKKLDVVPGMTCLWQVRGRADITDFNDWVRMDLEYIENWSLSMDLRILFRTVAVVFLGRGAY